MNGEAYQWKLYAGDQRVYTNTYNGQTVVSSNRYNQEWISSTGRSVYMTNAARIHTITLDPEAPRSRR